MRGEMMEKRKVYLVNSRIHTSDPFYDPSRARGEATDTATVHPTYDDAKMAVENAFDAFKETVRDDWDSVDHAESERYLEPSLWWVTRNEARCINDNDGYPDATWTITEQEV